MFNNSITRAQAQALVPEQVSNAILSSVPTHSYVMQLARQLPNLARNQARMPIISVLPTAGFVNGDTGLKASSTVNWTNKYLNVEEIAVIVPIGVNVLNDADYDMWGVIQPELTKAIAQTFDGAVLFGTAAPASWPTGLVPGAVAASNTVSLAASTDLYDAVLGPAGTLAKVEADGFQVNGHIADLSMKSKYRGLRDANGQPIFLQTMQQAYQYELDGNPIYFDDNGSWVVATALQLSGDWNQVVWAYRTDMTFQIFNQGVVQDNSGNIIYNLMQQDMVAMRVVVRLAWQIANTINRINSNDTTRYAFSALLP